MMPHKCSLCSREMVTLPVTSNKGTMVVVAICRNCDRRICKECGPRRAGRPCTPLRLVRGEVLMTNAAQEAADRIKARYAAQGTLHVPQPKPSYDEGRAS